MKKCILLLIVCLYPIKTPAITLDFLVGKLYAENLELKVINNKIGYSMAQVKGAFSGHLPSLAFNNAVTKGKDFESSSSTVSNTSVAPAGMDSLSSQGGSNVGTSNTTTENEAWTTELSFSIPIFSRFAVESSVKTAKNNVRYDILTLKEMRYEKKSQLIRLILEINILEDIRKTILEADKIISMVKSRSRNSRTRGLYNKKELLELDTRYYELIYQKTRVEEGLGLARKAMYDLIPDFKTSWFDKLPKLKISYEIPSEQLFKDKYHKQSLTWKKDSLQINSTRHILKATRWERPWIPMIVTSGSYGYSGDFKNTPKDGDWRITVGVTFELFDGFRSSSRRGQALHSHLISTNKRKINMSKKLLLLKHDSMSARVSRAHFNHKMAIARDKKHKLDQTKKLSRSGTTTKFEQSVLMIDYAKTRFEAYDALKKYQVAILDIAKTLNEFEKVEIHENSKAI